MTKKQLKAEYNKKYREANKEKIKEYFATYYQEKRDEIVQRSKEYRLANPEKVAEAKRNCYLKNSEHYNNKMKTWSKQRASKDTSFRIARNLRRRLNHVLKRKTKLCSAVRDLGCSIEFLKSHLEARFKPGMTWDNYGKRGWSIDHIRPLVSFDLTDPEQQKQAVHYTNLQPLWASENSSKGGRYVNSER
jgi:hypothetical protein